MEETLTARVAQLAWSCGHLQAPPLEGLERLANLLQRHRYRFADELQLHDGMAQVMASAGVPFQREYVAGPADRFDFLLPAGVVIEAKVRRSMPEALRQVDRYLARADVSAVLLVSTRHWIRMGTVPAELHGKPLVSVRLFSDFV